MEKLIENIRNAVETYDREAVIDLANEAIEKGFNPVEVIERGLAEGARIVGDKFDNLEIFLTELMLAADTMKSGINILLSELPNEKMATKGTIIIGTVRGDIHDIGKSIMANLLIANGFNVYDLGVDIPSLKFIEEAEKVNADIIMLSALLTTSLVEQKDFLNYLKDTGKREKFIVIVGGGAATQEWAKEIKADGYAETAPEGVKLAIHLIEKKRRCQI